MTEKEFELEQLPEVAKIFINAIGDSNVFLFEGEMGAGKTTFISEVCRQLGADDDFGSPTFSLINEYSDSKGNPIYHLDLYRISSVRELYDLGVEDYFNSGALCLVEWPDRLGELEPDDARMVEISESPSGKRHIKF